MSRDVVVVSGVRTAVGKLCGGLSDVPVDELAELVIKSSIQRAEISSDRVELVNIDSLASQCHRGMKISDLAKSKKAFGESSLGLSSNVSDRSGLHAILSASQSILVGDANIAIGGGADSMSRGVGYRVSRDTHTEIADGYDFCSLLGICADDEERYIKESLLRVERATTRGYFRDQIVPVILRNGEDGAVVDTDEKGCVDNSVIDTVPIRAGHTSPDVGPEGRDGAASIVLMEAKTAKSLGLTPIARLVSYGYAEPDSKYLGIGSVPATQIALKKAGLTVNDIEVVESGEDYAAQTCAFIRAFELNPIMVNPNGSGALLGQPAPATGAISTVKAVHELRRIHGRYALVARSFGRGEGLAAIFERT